MSTLFERWPYPSRQGFSSLHANGVFIILPERLGQVELLDMLPGRRRDVQGDRVAGFRAGVQERADEGERYRLRALQQPSCRHQTGWCCASPFLLLGDDGMAARPLGVEGDVVLPLRPH
jgi:hypothetical protein